MTLFDYMVTQGEDVTMFGDSESCLSPEYCKVIQEKFELRRRLLQCCGPEMEELLDEYTEVVESQEDFVAEHYFAQGFLAAQRQKQKKKRPS